MKKIICIICSISFWGCSNSTLQASGNRVKRFFSNPQQLRQEELIGNTNKAINAEIDKAYSQQYGSFLINLSAPFTNYEDVLNNFRQELQKNIQADFAKNGRREKVSIKTLPKNNMLLNAAIYEDLKIAEEALSTAQNNLLKMDGPCSTFQGNYDLFELSNMQATSKEWLCLQNPKYQHLLKQLDNLREIKETIYEESYEYEKNKFIKTTGMDISDIRPLTATLLNYMTEKPTPNTIYALDNIKVLQNTPLGILVGGTNIMYEGSIYTDEVAFIYTNKHFVDGQPLYGTVKYVGTYDYNSTLEVGRRVNAYKFFKFRWKDYKLNPRKFYFYPEIKPISEYSPNLIFDELILKYADIDGKSLSSLHPTN